MPKLESLQLRQFIPASPERVFKAWTDPQEMKKWWGPKDVNCLAVEVDLRVGGEYRIANQLPDKSVLWITGNFEVIEQPNLLVYSWKVENAEPSIERVEVHFEHNGLGTDVIIKHQQIPGKVLSEQHLRGWKACAEGLHEYISDS